MSDTVHVMVAGRKAGEVPQQHSDMKGGYAPPASGYDFTEEMLHRQETSYEQRLRRKRVTNPVEGVRIRKTGGGKINHTWLLSDDERGIVAKPGE